MTTILGISTSHDGTLSVLRDGRHVFSIAEERLSRIKGNIGFPFLALEYVVAEGIVDPKDVSRIAVAQAEFHVGTNRGLEFEYTRDKVYYDLQNDPRPKDYEIRQPKFRGCKSAAEVAERLKQVVGEIAAKVGITAEVDLVDHHLSHAAAVYFASEAPDPLVITLDGEGDGLSGSVSIIENGEITRLAGLDQGDSLGNVYSAVTRQLGYKISRHEGKITGLAAYGDPEKGAAILSGCFEIEDGKPGYRRSISGAAKSALGKLVGARNAPKYAANPKAAAALIADLSPEDQSAAVQQFIEDQGRDFVAYWVEKTGKKHVLLNGGVFANVKLNQRIGDLDPVESVFIFPNMGDGGNAIGAAQIAAHRAGDTPPRIRQPDVYLGPEFDNDAIETALSQNADWLDFARPDTMIADLAAAIHEGEIVGWFQGRMEYGPRALGSRSILARPTERALNDVLNKRLSRTEFMPFAPSCLIEEGEACFEMRLSDLSLPAEFMTITFDVKPEWVERIQAVSHVDDTARPQFVRKDTNPRYHAVISEYYRLSGIPMVVNTSFNNHEEPIVCQPSEGIAALKAGVIDILAIGDFVARKKSG